MLRRCQGEVGSISQLHIFEDHFAFAGPSCDLRLARSMGKTVGQFWHRTENDKGNVYIYIYICIYTIHEDIFCVFFSGLNYI